MAKATPVFPVAEAQALRLRRMIWGLGVQACTVLVVLALYGMDMLPGQPVMIYLGMIAALDLGFLAIVKTGFNLRFQDPSLTAQQITLSIPPIIYIMFFAAEPEARVALLLMGTTSLLFGMFGLNRRGMLLLVCAILSSYLGLLLALFKWAPERLNLPADLIVLLSYGCVLTINAYLASIISNMRSKLKLQNRELAELAGLDPLTRLPNRRALMAHLTKASEASERRDSGQEGMCVAILDVDHFKDINDTWGHEAGDSVLCDIGDALESALREDDFVGRFGGEEFVLVFPQTSLEAADGLSNRLRKTVGALNFSDLPPERPVTVSIGVADHRAGERIGDTLRRADEALYRAKQGGRNQVVLTEPGPI